MLGRFEEEWEKIIEEFYAKRTYDGLAEKLSESGVELVIFGAGEVGTRFAAALGSLSGKLVAFCDNYKTGTVEGFSVPIITPDQLLRQHRNAIIVIAASDYYSYSSEIYNQLIQMGFSSERLFRRYCGYDLLMVEELTQHKEGYGWAYDFFSDDIEKRIILDRMRAYLFYHELTCLPEIEQYFDPGIIELTDHEVFVDGGCYIGDTSLELMKRTSGKYSHIYGFEPDFENYCKARENLTGYKNVEIFNDGLYHQQGELSFILDESSSRILGETKTTKLPLVSVHTTTLDNFFSDTNTKPPTFIKFDIEGAEKNALIGAKNVIEEVHPKLAICVYHKPEDIYEIPQLINEFGGYSFKLRHYTKGIWETVLYAVPK